MNELEAKVKKKEPKLKQLLKQVEYFIVSVEGKLSGTSAGKRLSVGSNSSVWKDFSDWDKGWNKYGK